MTDGFRSIVGSGVGRSSRRGALIQASITPATRLKFDRAGLLSRGFPRFDRHRRIVGRTLRPQLRPSSGSTSSSVMTRCRNRLLGLLSARWR